jgi:hypothetical protein
VTDDAAAEVAIADVVMVKETSEAWDVVALSVAVVPITALVVAVTVVVSVTIILSEGLLTPGHP